MVAAELAVKTMRCYGAFTHCMGTFRFTISHTTPPSAHSTPQNGLPRTRRVRLTVALVLAACALASAGPAQQPESLPEDLARTLARVGQQVERWYASAQHVVSTEDLWIQPLRSDLTPIGFARRLTFELRLEWDPAAAGPGGVPVARVLRQQLGERGGSDQDSDAARCMDPKPVSPEPLAMLLPARLGELDFTAAGTARLDGRSVLRIDYSGRGTTLPEITWTGACVELDLQGRSRGRIWVDASTYEVLRLDDQLVGTFAFDVPRDQARRGLARSMVVERAESSIRYTRMEFQDPDETLMLPASVETLTVIRGGSTQRTRVTQRFSDYRRFLTAGRIVP